MPRLTPFLPSQRLPGLGDCVIDQCHQNQVVEDLWLLPLLHRLFPRLTYQALARAAARITAVFEFPLLAWASSLAAKGLQPGPLLQPPVTTLGFVPAPLELVAKSDPSQRHHGPAEQPVPGFNVPAAIPAISLTCAPLQLPSMDCPPQARSARGLGHAGPGLYSQGPDKQWERGECAHMPALS